MAVWWVIETRNVADDISWQVIRIENYIQKSITSKNDNFISTLFHKYYYSVSVPRVTQCLHTWVEFIIYNL